MNLLNLNSTVFKLFLATTLITITTTASLSVYLQMSTTRMTRSRMDTVEMIPAKIPASNSCCSWALVEKARRGSHLRPRETRWMGDESDW